MLGIALCGASLAILAFAQMASEASGNSLLAGFCQPFLIGSAIVFGCVAHANSSWHIVVILIIGASCWFVGMTTADWLRRQFGFFKSAAERLGFG
jgi:hypothetical protein